MSGIWQTGPFETLSALVGSAHCHGKRRRIKKRRSELARRRQFWYNIAHERQDRMSANENQIGVYQPNETVRLDMLAKRGIREREAA